jgi:hypothetical protein
MCLECLLLVMWQTLIIVKLLLLQAVVAKQQLKQKGFY